MEFLDARRLTGPSLLFDKPGSILDVACDANEAARLVPAWERQVRRLLAGMDWPDTPEFASLDLTGGVSLGFTAPIDALYVASGINEWAYSACAAELEGTEAPDFEAAVTRLAAEMAEESNPDLQAVQAAAAENDTTFLWDDDEASLGLGRYSTTWPVRGLPDPADLDWGAFRDVPIGLVTGTNGKTTCVRIAAHILGAAGLRSGFSSTDFIAIDGEIVDRDDWSGPGGARAVLRNREVEAAILETARGGLLRRGLGVERADAALVTNIGRDHLGDFGSRTQLELLDCKWIISRAVVDGGTLVLNADDELLVQKALGYGGRITWFSLDPASAVLAEHVAAGGTTFLADGDRLLCRCGDSEELVSLVGDVPLTLSGAARHNVANALAAAGLVHGMGIDLGTIRSGLQSMTPAQNPGRGNVYQVGGVTVVVDFAHNPQAMQALFAMAGRLPAQRRALCFGQAGDRPDDLVRELARDAWYAGLDRVHVSELAKYHRGREDGEIYGIIRDELLSLGAHSEQLQHYDAEIDALDAALAWARDGDLVIMLALERSAELYARLEDLAAGKS